MALLAQCMTGMLGMVPYLHSLISGSVGAVYDGHAGNDAAAFAAATFHEKETSPLIFLL